MPEENCFGWIYYFIMSWIKFVHQKKYTILHFVDKIQTYLWTGPRDSPMDPTSQHAVVEGMSISVDSLAIAIILHLISSHEIVNSSSMYLS